MKMTADDIRAHALKHGLPCELLPASAPIAGKVLADPSPAQVKWQRGEERKLNELVCADLRRRGIPFIVARTDKESTIRPGWPDITALRLGKGCCVELKAENGKLTAAQRARHEELRAAQVPILVAYNFNQAIEFILSNLP